MRNDSWGQNPLMSQYKADYSLGYVHHEIEMNYPAASHGVSKARQQYENYLEASFGVWTRGAIKGFIPIMHGMVGMDF